MSESHGWVPAAAFSTGLEADMARQLLEDAGIPVIVRSDQSGIFGAAFQGVVPGGVALMVPGTALKEAKALLNDIPDPTSLET